MRILITASELQEAFNRSVEDSRHSNFMIELPAGSVCAAAEHLTDCDDLNQVRYQVASMMAHWLRLGMALEARRREARRLKQILQL